MSLLTRDFLAPFRRRTAPEARSPLAEAEPAAIRPGVGGRRLTSRFDNRSGTLGFVAYEGELGITGDRAFFNGGLGERQLSNATNPANNFFNSSISALGLRVTTKNPDSVNQLGFGADLLAADTLRYTLPVSNAASALDAAVGVLLEHALPANTTYVPGSLVITARSGGIDDREFRRDDQSRCLFRARSSETRRGPRSRRRPAGSNCLRTSIGPTSSAVRRPIWQSRRRTAN